MTSCTAPGLLSHLMDGLRENSRMARGQALASRSIIMEVHMKVNSLMEIIMDRESTDGHLADNIRASSLKTEAMASVSKLIRTGLTRATSKTTSPMELESGSTLSRTSTRDNGKMDCFTASAHCTLELKGR